MLTIYCAVFRRALATAHVLGSNCAGIFCGGSQFLYFLRLFLPPIRYERNELFKKIISSFVKNQDDLYRPQPPQTV